MQEFKFPKIGTKLILKNKKQTFHTWIVKKGQSVMLIDLDLAQGMQVKGQYTYANIGLLMNALSLSNYQTFIDD